MTDTPSVSRRDFIKLSIKFLFGLISVLSLGGLVRFLNYKSHPELPSEFNLGDIAMYPLGSRTIRSDIPAVIYNDAGEIIAFSLTCTHLGCMVEENGEEFSCPCHGSRFGKDGQVLKGPAQKPLRRLHVEVQEDQALILFTNRAKE